MLMIADFSMFGQRYENNGQIYLLLMQLPGPYALAVKEGDPTPAQTHIVNLTEKGSILTPKAAGGNGPIR